MPNKPAVKSKNKTQLQLRKENFSDSGKEDEAFDFRSFERRNQESLERYFSTKHSAPESTTSSRLSMRLTDSFTYGGSSRSSGSSLLTKEETSVFKSSERSMINSKKTQDKVPVRSADVKSGLELSSENSDKKYDSWNRANVLKKIVKISNFNARISNESNETGDWNKFSAAERISVLKPEDSSDISPSDSIKIRMKMNRNRINEGIMKSSWEEQIMAPESGISAPFITPDRVRLWNSEAVRKRPEKFTADSKENSETSNINTGGMMNFFAEGVGNDFERRRLFNQMNAIPDKSKPMGEDLLVPEVTRMEDLKIKRHIQEMYFYIIFLIFVTIIALSMVSTNMYYFTDLTTVLFFDTTGVPSSNKSVDNNLLFYENQIHHSPRKTLRESNTIADFWMFAEFTMIDLFYWHFFNSHEDPSTHTKDDDRERLFENQMLGVPRMRQVRVRNDSCEIHPNVKRFFDHCYNYYSIFAEETRPIKTGMESSSTASAWVYTEAKHLNTTYYWGEISIYGGGGYYLDFGKTKKETEKMMKELKEKQWISGATRAIFIDFNLYNANVNLFCICKIVLEFPPVGGMIPRADFHSLKFIRYLTIMDFFVLACEFVLILFIIYFTYAFIRSFIKEKSSFFFSWWNYVDLLILLLSYIYIFFTICLYVYVADVTESLSDRYYDYTEFAQIKEMQINYNNVVAVLLFICWIKLFKYFDFNVVLVEFKRTLSRSFVDILGFFPMFLTIFVAFALLAYLLFGNEVKSYRTFWSSFLALLQAFLGEFQYEKIQESNRILGPIFYMAFIFFIFFVLLNVFIAIINDAYATVKSEVMMDSPKTGEYFKRGFLNFLGCCCRGLRKKLEKKSLMRSKAVLQEIKLALKKAGFSDDEIRIFFSKYKIDTTNVLNEETKSKIVSDLELKRLDFSEDAEQFQINTLRRRIDSLNERLEEIESSLQPVIDKVDVLLKRL